MAKYFDIKKIENNIFLIKETCYKENASIYLFSGKKKSLLVDSGTGMFDIKKFLENLGFKNIYLTLTHSHFDHAGGIKYFDKEKIILPKKIINNLENKKFWGIEYLDKKDFKNISNETLNNFYKNFKIILPKIKVQKKLNIDIGNFSFDLINMPGHTDDSFTLFDKKNKILLTGDALYNGKIYCQMPNSNKEKFIVSLKKIIKLNYELILPGHNNLLYKKDADKIAKQWIEILK